MGYEVKWSWYRGELEVGKLKEEDKKILFEDEMSYTDVVDSGGRGSGKHMAEKGEDQIRRWWRM